MTFAMFLAKKGFLPPKRWYHDESFVNRKGYTLMDILKSKKVVSTEYYYYSECYENGRILPYIFGY